MNKLPLITGIVPCYNHEKWVIQALRSITSSQYPNLQLVFIDDGSTDNSWATVFDSCERMSHITKQTQEPEILAHGFFDKYRILLVKLSKNYGPSIARNYGIQSTLSNTNIYAFLDADDEYLDKKIEKSLDYFLEDSRIGVVYSDYITYNIDSNITVHNFKYPYSIQELQRECLPNMDSLFNAEIFRKVGLFDDTLRVCEDYDMYLRSSSSFIHCHIPTALVKIRVHNKSSTSSVSKEEWQENYTKVFKKYYNKQ